MDKVLVTGATGLVGRQVVAELLAAGIPVRALIRSPLAGLPSAAGNAHSPEIATGTLDDAAALSKAVKGVTGIVHCAAKVGDWGPDSEYRAVNVEGLNRLVEACRREAPDLRRFVHISSLGVYAARDHYGTDESEPTSRSGIDGYTRSKIEAEELLLTEAIPGGLPAVLLRPGFVYGPGDRAVLPKLIQKLRAGKFAFLGSGEQLLNNTAAENLALAVRAALFAEGVIGERFNITDGRLVSRLEFIRVICDSAGLPFPTRHVPLAVARPLARTLEALWRWTGRKEAPVLSQARIKFLGLHLDFNIDRARHRLGYTPVDDFQDLMRRTLQGSLKENA